LVSGSLCPLSRFGTGVLIRYINLNARILKAHSHSMSGGSI
jgi:hypothetical protein